MIKEDTIARATAKSAGKKEKMKGHKTENLQSSEITLINKKHRCRWCGKSAGVIKFYIIADDLENPKPYHPACIRELNFEVIKKLSDM